MLRALLLLTAFLLGGISSFAGAATSIREYLRSNSDGTEAETILVFRPEADKVEVVKLREPCTNAAYVTADVDRATLSSTRLSAGRLLPHAGREEFGSLFYDEAAHALVASLTVNGHEIRGRLPMQQGAWHLYDFDLASLSAVLEGQRNDRKPIRFHLPLVWNGDGSLMRDLGDVKLSFVQEEIFEGRRALRYEATGTSQLFRGGALWRDRKKGFILGASWLTPNHAEYSNFKLRLHDTYPGSLKRWKTLLAAHFANCPPR